ncbi:MAG TPA: S46 family peptidase, partial [Bacteroidota bacterium]|nr:S46 family peptidase [Bacteroidota bacterium]
MKTTVWRLPIILTVLALFPAGRWADEGMWLLDTSKLPFSAMKKEGLELSPEQIYNPHGKSLTDAVLLLGGGTASFVSAEGLILTNHHVAYGSIQALSSVQDDYLRNGFWAKSKSEELSTSLTAQMVREFRDVTSEILSTVNDSMNAEQRARAIQTRIQDVERIAKGATESSCRVSETFNGLNYYLTVYQPVNDIRLVYAPPGSIGNFGGEVDNWIWPRHTGDFSILRAYVAPDGKAAKYSKDNVPYRPSVFLPISLRGFTEGSFAMILGFPARTFRYREAAAVQLARDETLPATIDLYKTRMDIIDGAGRSDRAVQIKYANKVRGIANTYKNYLGVLEGMRRADLITLKRNEERGLDAYIHSQPELTAKYGSLLADLEKANNEMKSVNRKNLFAMNMAMGIDIYRIAGRFKAFALAFTTDSAGQPAPPPERDRAALKDFVAATFRNEDPRVEKQLCAALLLKEAAYPADEQLAVFREAFGNKTGADLDQTVQDYVEDLYSTTRLATPDGCESLMDGTADAILADPYVTLVTQIDGEPIAARTGAINTRLNSLRQKYLEAWIGWKQGTPVYPDANRSIRLTYGQVKSFTPRDGVLYQFETTLAGVMEKESGEEPFEVPPRLRELWQKKDFGPYADPRVGDVPVAFISNLDITGGNSGSPVLNGRGELIGCAFDGNWESVVG